LIRFWNKTFVTVRTHKRLHKNVHKASGLHRVPRGDALD
jgi:hypothetical protein